MATSPSPSPRRARDTIPWLLVVAAAAVLAIVAGVVVIDQTDSYLWVVVVVVLLVVAAVAGGAGVVRLTDGPALPARQITGATAHGPTPDWRGPDGSPHVLVVASELVDGPQLRAALPDGVALSTAVLVVAPAFTSSRLRFWVSDTDAGTERARAVEQASVAALRRAGFAAEGHVGSADPVTAIEDALRFFEPELIVLFLHASRPRGYRERPLRAEVERRFSRPVIELDPPRRAVAGS